MASGKLTPRQKMINMMYLVLTAMLALNVSVEVLDKFKIMDKGLTNSIKIIQDRNTVDLTSFKKAYDDSPLKVAEWKEKADTIDVETKKMHEYLHKLKVLLIQDGDGEEALALLEPRHINVDLIEAFDNTSVASRVMLGENNDGKAYELRKKIEEYKKFMLEIVGSKSPTTVKSIEELLLLEDPTNTDGMRSSWEIAVFYNAPLVSAIAQLSKMQLDVVSCQSEALTYLKQAISADDFKVSSIKPVVIPNSNYVIQGTEYTAEIFLAASDESQQPILREGGSTRYSNDKGIISVKIPATTVGKKTLQGTVEFMGPDGTKKYEQISKEYYVAEPNVVVSPTKMNVVYRGIDNPMNISLSGVSLDKLNVNPSNGTIERVGNGFMLRPGSGRTCDISVSVDGKNMGTVPFRVKDLPIPTPSIDGISGKTAGRNELVASLGMRAEMKDFDFDLRYTIVSFTVSVVIDGYEQTQTSNSSGFTNEQKQLFNRVRPGNRVNFTDIKAKGPDGRVVELATDLSIRIR